MRKVPYEGLIGAVTKATRLKSALKSEPPGDEHERIGEKSVEADMAMVYAFSDALRSEYGAYDTWLQAALDDLEAWASWDRGNDG